MTDRIIMIDYEKCVGCRLCELVCSIFNDGECHPAKARIQVVMIQKEAEARSIPLTCMKCVEPACVAVCPMGAISEDPSTGARMIDEKKCIGCSACVYACPFGAIALDRSLGHSYTCNLCKGDPTCVKFCPKGALQYVDSEEVSIRRRRSALNRYADFLQSINE